MIDENPTPETQENAKKDTVGPAEPAESDEINGYKALGLPKPTRYGDWEVKGRCSDF